MSYDAIYKARTTGRNGSVIDVFVPQIFGDTPIKVSDFIGAMPTGMGMGWVLFQGGDPSYPIWLADVGLGSGSGTGTGVNEVYVGTDPPTDPGVELWYDTDATPAPVTPVPWTTVATFASANWRSYNADPLYSVQYRRVGDVVELRGMPQRLNSTCTTTETVFTLPAGYYNPSRYHTMYTVCSTAIAVAWVITPTGIVQTTQGAPWTGIAANAWITLDGFKFSVTP